MGHAILKVCAQEKQNGKNSCKNLWAVSHAGLFTPYNGPALLIQTKK
jgi:hypothetical protein